MSKKYQVDKKQIKEINNALQKTKDTKIYKRLQALKLRFEGKKYRELPMLTGLSESAVTKIVAKYFKDGLSAILEDKRTGNNRKLTVEQEKELLAPFDKAAKAGQILVVAEIKKAYDEMTGEESSIPTVYKLLHRHNWRKIKPRSRHPKKASDEAIAAYKKNQYQD